MNEIIAVLYYCFNEDPSPFMKQYIESDLFFVFTNLMAEIRDGFCRTLDSEETGIKGRIEKFSQLMAKFEPEVHRHLANHQVNP